MKDINAVVADLQSKGFGKIKIEAFLEVSGYALEDIKALNLEGKSQVELDAEAVMREVIAMETSSMNNKQKATKLHSLGLCSEKTGYHILSLMKFIKAYHTLKSAK